jgi:hypothetical protein
MGLLRCSIESKAIEMVVEGRSSRVWIRESCRGYIRYMFLGKADSCWLVATVEELLQEIGMLVPWRRSRASSLAVLAQCCSNKHMGVSWSWRST